ncbi:hypothetical protein [Streptomyces sp. NPDC001389]|uniref:hypothetical protein n=1 Tax=Streptomyces sp. NPDC001389 TaxID=3364569 RepID=UPI0036B81CF7
MPEAWPKDVIARYLTKAAEILGKEITVDVVQSSERTLVYCNGCDRNPADEPNYLAAHAYKKAEEHAALCRAMPHPNL